MVSIGIFVGGIAVEGKLTLQTDPEQWVNQNSQTIKDIKTVERLTGGSSELGVFARSKDVFTDKFATFAHDLTDKTLARVPEPAPHRVEHRDRHRRHHRRRPRCHQHRTERRRRARAPTTRRRPT